MTRSITIREEAYKKLYAKKKLVADKTGLDDPSLSDIIIYLCHQVDIISEQELE